MAVEMTKALIFDCGDGSVTHLNSLQLTCLLRVPTDYTPFATYWALRGRELIAGTQHNKPHRLTPRGEAVLAHYAKMHRGV